MRASYPFTPDKIGSPPPRSAAPAASSTRPLRHDTRVLSFKNEGEDDDHAV
jgi:hypothetical protein